MAFRRNPPRRGGTARRRAVEASANTLWTDEELRRSVDVYVLLLRLQMQGMDERSEPIAQALLKGPLALRNGAAIRYRMRNISAVVRESGVQTLNDFSPAESVGSGVRSRIRAMLLENRDFARLRAAIVPSSQQQRRRDAFTALGALRDRIGEIEHELSLLGHNNPPEVIGAEGLDREQFRQALDDVDALADEVTAENPDLVRVRRSKSRLVRFAIAVAKWLGDRATNFTDENLKSIAKYAGPALALQVSGLLPAIVDALEAVAKALIH